MAKRDISKPTYYLDACIFIDLIECPATQEPAKTIAAVIADAEDEKCNLVTSVLTITEVVYAKHEINQKAIDPAIEVKLDHLWHPSGSPIQLVDVHELIVREANRLLRDNLKRGWTKTRGNDAIHLVTAKREFVDEFFTNEKAMEKWGEVLGFKVCAPHSVPLPQEESGSLFAKEGQPKPISLPQTSRPEPPPSD
ncbi:MAG: PIN domain-containing protein [Planctomycetota bacterium]|nr:PIN domain-containing protein [Planctomycetota bacterium]